MTRNDSLSETAASDRHGALAQASYAAAPGANTAIRRHALTLDGRALSFIEAGAGEPLVLLHGIGSCADSWSPIVPLLAARFRIVAWDMPGYGESAPLGDARPAAGSYAALLAELLEALKISRAHVLGHSLGALVGAELAVTRPDLVRSLILASPALGSASPIGTTMPDAIRQRLVDLSADGAAAFARKRAPNLCGDKPRPEAVRAVEESMSRVRLPGYEQACWLLAQGDLPAAVSKLAVPGLVVGAAQDKVVPPERAKHLAAQWPGSLYREIPSVGHAGYVEDPGAYIAPIGAFIGDIQRRV